MKVFVTGAAGFIGSQLVDRLLEIGHEVTGYDNFSTGRRAFLEHALKDHHFSLIAGDLLNADYLFRAIQVADPEMVFHFAANADVRYGIDHPCKDIGQNIVGTSNVLEAMRECGVRRIVFASTGAVYGEPSLFPTPENAPMPIQTSFYGASKLAAEGLISAYCTGFGFQAHIFRFVSILGERYTHGHVIDFYKQLKAHPEHLDVLGDGKQQKSYLHVQDCIDAVVLATNWTREAVNVFNLGTNEHCTVDDSIRLICELLGVSPLIRYVGGDRGWAGDSPLIFLDCSKIRRLGWVPKLTIREALARTVQFLQENNKGCQ
jgi:UDP-glucose 4-epimerase